MGATKAMIAEINKLTQNAANLNGQRLEFELHGEKFFRDLRKGSVILFTLHKTQGSQFPRIIIALQKGMIVDRAWLYTAITRAEREIHIIGTQQDFNEITTLPSNLCVSLYKPCSRMGQKAGETISLSPPKRLTNRSC